MELSSKMNSDIFVTSVMNPITIFDYNETLSPPVVALNLATNKRFWIESI